MKVAHQAALTLQALHGDSGIWDMALPGQRWPPVCWRESSALMLPTRRQMLGQTSSWALGCQIQILGLDFRPACTEVSGFMLTSGLARVKNWGDKAWEQASSGQGCEGAATGHGAGERV